MKGRARVKGGFSRKILPGFGFLFRECLRDRELDDGVEISVCFTGACGKTASLDAKFGRMIGQRRDLDADFSGEGFHGHLCSENSLPWSEQKFIVEIRTNDAKIRMFFQTNMKEKIAGLASISTRIPEARAADELALGDSLGNADF